MLRELHIQNLAVIEDLTVEFEPGLNVFTGETGAGKSLIIGAFETLLGLRAASEAAQMLRGGQAEARISGVFEVKDERTAAEVSALLDQTIEPNEPVLITRKLFASGRSGTSVNGRPATAAMVKAAGELLVDIHGQHDHQYLLRPSNQLAILDGFARCGEERERFGGLYAELRELTARKAELEASAALRSQQLELYEFQAEEIDAAEPQEGEFPELMARHKVFANLQKIQGRAGQVYAALYEADGSAVERLQAMTQVLLELAELDEGLSDVAEMVRTCTLTLQEAAYELDRYTHRLDLDPGEAAEVEERLNSLNRLIRKYGGDPRGAAAMEDPLAEVLALRARLGEDIERLQGETAGLSGMDEETARLTGELREVGGALSRKRREAAGALRPLVEAELAELGMGEAKLEVAIETVDPDPEEATATGLDRVEFLVQTNPGQEPRPLRKIASGGELSRVMLALKSILAGSDRISVLVFDEIDANIGGRLGSVIGRKLRQLANGGREGAGAKPRAASEQAHQVLCITHLPQIAAFGDRHFRILKTVSGSGKARTTRTTVTPLEGAVRVDELAEMMAGKDITLTTRKQAEELIATAAT